MASALGLILFCLCSHFALRTAGNEAAKGIALGTFTGLLLLVNPACLVPAGLWFIFVCRQSSLPSIRRFVAGAAAACLLTCLPWIVRCYNRFGQVFPIRDNFGFELHAANNDCAEFSLARNMENGCHNLTHPNVSLAEARLVRAMGEANYSRYRMDTAIAWIKDHPGRFLGLTVERFVHFWYPEPDFEGERLPVYSIWLLTTLSFVGLSLIRARGIPVFRFIASVFILYPIPYYLVQSSARFLYPIFWLNLLCAGYCIETVACRFRESRKQRGDTIAIQLARSQP
jgi:4-amino-4-deoxy-L-arabinose transferase-like glycosyltransferase